MTQRHRLTLFRILGAAVLLLLLFLLPPLPPLFATLAALVPYLLVGYDVLFPAVRNLLRGAWLDENFLMTISTVGAFALGEIHEAVAVMLFYQVGELFSGYATEKSRRAALALAALAPDEATVLTAEGERRLPTEEVTVGTCLRVRPGERIPLDGTVTEGESTIDTSSLTGEGLPLACHVGDVVHGGTVNLTSPITLRVTKPYEESTVARILTLVEEASDRKARTERFITRFSRYYTPAVVGAALLLFLLPSLITGAWSVWLLRALSFLVVSCPCALVLSVPLSYFGAIGGAARRGVLVKGANALEALAACDTAVFDKTGTLTYGKFAIDGVFPEEGIRADELCALAATAERFSTHPIARCLAASAPTGAAPQEVREIAGQGVIARIDGREVAIGNAALMKTYGILPREATGTAVHLCREGHYLGYLTVSDRIRPEAAATLAALHRHGIRRLVMLTGDREEPARRTAAAVGIGEVHAALLPGGKVAAMEALIAEGAHPLYLGDGINDAPVLARADVGLAMGKLGSEAATEAADIVLLGGTLASLGTVVRLSHSTRRIVLENIILSLAVKAAILALSAVGIAGLGLAIFGDVGVLVLAVLNSLRTLKQ